MIFIQSDGNNATVTNKNVCIITIFMDKFPFMIILTCIFWKYYFHVLNLAYLNSEVILFKMFSNFLCRMNTKFSKVCGPWCKKLNKKKSYLKKLKLSIKLKYYALSGFVFSVFAIFVHSFCGSSKPLLHYFETCFC